MKMQTNNTSWYELYRISDIKEYISAEIRKNKGSELAKLLPIISEKLGLADRDQLLHNIKLAAKEILLKEEGFGQNHPLSIIWNKYKILEENAEAENEKEKIILSNLLQIAILAGYHDIYKNIYKQKIDSLNNQDSVEIEQYRSITSICARKICELYEEIFSFNMDVVSPSHMEKYKDEKSFPKNNIDKLLSLNEIQALQEPVLQQMHWEKIKSGFELRNLIYKNLAANSVSEANKDSLFVNIIPTSEDLHVEQITNFISKIKKIVSDKVQTKLTKELQIGALEAYYDLYMAKFQALASVNLASIKLQNYEKMTLALAKEISSLQKGSIKLNVKDIIPKDLEKFINHEKIIVKIKYQEQEKKRLKEIFSKKQIANTNIPLPMQTAVNDYKVMLLLSDVKRTHQLQDKTLYLFIKESCQKIEDCDSVFFLFKRSNGETAEGQLEKHNFNENSWSRLKKVMANAAIMDLDLTNEISKYAVETHVSLYRQLDKTTVEINKLQKEQNSTENLQKKIKLSKELYENYQKLYNLSENISKLTHKLQTHVHGLIKSNCETALDGALSMQQNMKDIAFKEVLGVGQIKQKSNGFKFWKPKVEVVEVNVDQLENKVKELLTNVTALSMENSNGFDHKKILDTYLTEQFRKLDNQQLLKLDKILSDEKIKKFNMAVNTPIADLHESLKAELNGRGNPTYVNESILQKFFHRIAAILPNKTSKNSNGNVNIPKLVKS